MKPRILGILLAGILLCCGTPASADDESRRPPTDAELEALVRQLGDPSFPVRERAARELTDAGLDAQTALLAGLSDRDLEIRLRAHQILVTILQSDFNRQLAAFIEGDDSAHELELPGWPQFRDVAGDSRPARELFAEMMRVEADLLEVYEQGGSELQREFLNRLQTLQSLGFTVSGGQQEIQPASLATLLFIATKSDIPADSVITSRMYSLLNLNSAKQSILHGSQSELMRRMLDAWISRATSGTRAYYGLMLCLNYDLGETGVELARKMLEQPSPLPIVVQFAAITIGRFGSEEDIAILERHLGNTAVCHTWSNPQLKKDLIRIQVRDVVLAMSIYLTGQDPEEFGFELLERDPKYVYRIWTFGFLEDEDRQDTLQRWQAFRNPPNEDASDEDPADEDDSSEGEESESTGDTAEDDRGPVPGVPHP